MLPSTFSSLCARVYELKLWRQIMNNWHLHRHELLSVQPKNWRLACSVGSVTANSPLRPLEWLPLEGRPLKLFFCFLEICPWRLGTLYQVRWQAKPLRYQRRCEGGWRLGWRTEWKEGTLKICARASPGFQVSSSHFSFQWYPHGLKKSRIVLPSKRRMYSV